MNKTLLSIIAAIVILGGIFYFTNKSGNPLPTPTKTGVIQSHRTYAINSDSQGKTYAVKTLNEYSFRIADEQGNILKDYAITHTKPMHVIIVRKDLAYFQHVHPTYDQATGIFTLNDLSFPSDGEYRIFADFAPTGGQMDSMGAPLAVTVSEDVKVGNLASYKPQSIGTEEKTKTFDGLNVTFATRDTPTAGIENMLMFNLSANGKPVTDLEPYLGALGHAVILREGNLDFIHAHPVENVNTKQNGVVSFMVDFPEAGRYKVFTQFQRGGKVVTTNFVITVTEGSGSTQGMNHSMK